MAGDGDEGGDALPGFPHAGTASTDVKEHDLACLYYICCHYLASVYTGSPAMLHFRRDGRLIVGRRRHMGVTAARWEAEPASQASAIWIPPTELLTSYHHSRTANRPITSATYYCRIANEGLCSCSPTVGASTLFDLPSLMPSRRSNASLGNTVEPRPANNVVLTPSRTLSAPTVACTHCPDRAKVVWPILLSTYGGTVVARTSSANPHKRREEIISGTSVDLSTLVEILPSSTEILSSAHSTSNAEATATGRQSDQSMVSTLLTRRREPRV